MSNFEKGYCSLADYFQYEPERVDEGSLSINGLYTLMIRFEASAKMSAARHPARINHLEENNDGGFVVDFTGLNGDLGPDYRTKGTFMGGYWRRKNQPLGFAIGANNAAEAYFKIYGAGNEIDEELAEMLEIATPLSGAVSTELAVI